LRPEVEIVLDYADLESRWIDPRPGHIEYDDPGAGPVAEGIAASLEQAGAGSSAPEYQPPQDATYGTPEIILTIVVTAAAKAVIVSGLHALERFLENQIAVPDDRRVRVALKAPGRRSNHSSISLRQAGKEALHSFVSDLVSAVEKF
jgi:hypothetical protein